MFCNNLEYSQMLYNNLEYSKFELLGIFQDIVLQLEYSKMSYSDLEVNYKFGLDM